MFSFEFQFFFSLSRNFHHLRWRRCCCGGCAVHFCFVAAGYWQPAYWRALVVVDVGRVSFIRLLLLSLFHFFSLLSAVRFIKINVGTSHDMHTVTGCTIVYDESRRQQMNARRTLLLSYYCDFYYYFQSIHWRDIFLNFFIRAYIRTFIEKLSCFRHSTRYSCTFEVCGLRRFVLFVQLFLFQLAVISPENRQI